MGSEGINRMSSQEKKRKQAFQDYYDEKIDELGVAKILGFPTNTEADKAEAIQKIRDMTIGGRDHTLSTKKPGSPPLPFMGGTGIFIDKTTVTSGGKVQIPVSIRKELDLKDGHVVYWFEKNGEIILVPSTPWRNPRLR